MLVFPRLSRAKVRTLSCPVLKCGAELSITLHCPGDSFYLLIGICMCSTSPWEMKVAPPALPKGTKRKGLVH